MSARIAPELCLAMALALESCEADIESALQLLARARRRIETVRVALSGAAESCVVSEAS
ncbi:MAG: hypothetical protein H7Y14_10365 [Burkholderiales bacterium]|nr:hypothetical protein [Burkholderiales bacterium]